MAAVRSLIVLGSSLTALAVVRVAHRTGLRCIMLDNVVGPAASTRFAEFRRLASMDMAAVADCVPALDGEDTAVIADSDRWLRFVRGNRQALCARWRVLHPSEDALDVCLDKSAFLEWCAAQGLPAPRLYDPATIEQLESAAYPLLIRPEWTQHSSGTGLPKALEVREPAQMRHWLKRFAAARVQPSISESLLRDGLRQFSVGAARDAAGEVVTFLAEKIRPHADQCAGGTFVAPAKEAHIEALAARALHALNFFGVAEVEILFDSRAERPYLVEINARPWLQYGLPFASGCDLLGHLLSRDRIQVSELDGQHAWLYFSSDLYACFSRSTGLVTTGKLSFAEYVRSLVAADVHAFWDWSDPGPWFISLTRSARDSLRRTLRRG
jgi:predicted ATP-grasp superfamily ATP-dependent carboligase